MYYYSDKADAIRVAMEDDYYFLGILPHENNIDEYLSTFNGEELYNLTSQSITTHDIYWRLPRLEYAYDVSLTDALKAMGMTDAFDENKSDLSRLSDREDLYVKDVMHKTRIELDKSGIKAAAVTAIVCVTTSMPMNIKYIYLDRPFVYAIMDSKTNTSIFIGAVKYL